DQAQEALEAIRRTSTEALDELRVTLALTRGEADVAGRAPTEGLARLPGLVAELRLCGLPVHVETLGEPRLLDREVDRAAFRVVQESLTNVLRHAGAAQAWVQVGYHPDALSLRVRDDGTGPSFAGPGAGHGLAGLRERAAELAGTLTAGPAPAGGWQVEVRIPIPRGVRTAATR
ncbi:MAG: sensor histidine kinase, partial [Mycobacteriales bacterium]